MGNKIFCYYGADSVKITIYFPAKHKKLSAVIAGAVFGVTYVVLMTKVFKIVKEKK